MDVSMFTTKMLTMGDMRLWTGEADMQVSPVVHNLLLALHALGLGQTIGRPEFEGLIVAAFATVEGGVRHLSEAAKVWTLVPVLNFFDNLF